MTLAALSLLLAGASAACVYDASSSPFAGLAPYIPTHATTFSIRYQPSYKVLNVTLGGTNYITTVSLCGAPVPTQSSLSLGANDQLVSQLSQPITKVSVTSTTYVPFLDITGHLPKLAAVAGASYFYSPCIRSSVASNAIADLGASFDYSAGPPSPSYGLQAILGGQWDDATLGGAKVLLAEDTETHALGVSEYMVYVAALFNDEATAKASFATIASRYACAAASASAAAASSHASPPSVLWVRSVTAATQASPRLWNVHACPNWYCGMVATAGGALLPLPAGAAAGLSDAAFQLLAAQADVLIYANFDFESALRPYLPGATAPPPVADAALTAILAASPAVAAGRVYDILGSAGTNGWFELRELNGDALLQELLAVMRPAAAASAGISRTPASTTFLRAAMAAGASVPGLLAASTCPAGVTSTPALLLSSACPGGSGGSSSSPAAVLASMPGAIAGIVIGCLAVAGLAALLACKALAAAGAGKAAPAVLSSTPAAGMSV